MQRRARVVVVAVLVALAGYALVPRRVVIAPRWSVRVLDANGRPYPHVRVVQSWVHYSLKTVPDFDERLTGPEGVVVFDERVVQLRGIDEISGALRMIAKIGIHASLGPDVFIVIGDPGAGGLGTSVPREKAAWHGDGLLSVVKLEGVAAASD